jgi:hypothetical protein
VVDECPEFMRLGMSVAGAAVLHAEDILKVQSFAAGVYQQYSPAVTLDGHAAQSLTSLQHITAWPGPGAAHGLLRVLYYAAAV